MTSQATPQQETIVQLPINVQVAPGPDGKHWVMLTVQDQLVSTSVRLPPGPAEQLANSIGGALRKAAVEARRADSGLVLATATEAFASKLPGAASHN